MNYCFVAGIIKNGVNMAPNIIPEFTEMEYFIRAPTKGELDIIVDKVIGCANGAATATGCTVRKKLIFFFKNIIVNMLNWNFLLALKMFWN